MTQPLNIVFAGTPDFAARHLQALIDSSHNVIAVYTQPDRPAGRGKKHQPSAVKQLANEHDLPVMQPQSLKDTSAQQQLAALQPDIMVVVAYGLILPQTVLDIPRLGCLNVHGSLLPKWRGAAPIQRAIWAGDAETGVTIMQMDQGLDTGDMLLKAALPIQSEDTSASLYDKLAELGPQALLTTLDKIEQLTPEKQQDADATYASKLSKEEAKIDWQTSALQLTRNVRAFNPWPVAYFPIESGPVKVWQAEVKPLSEEQKSKPPGQILSADKNGILVATGEQGLLISKLQLPGKKAMDAAAILNAKRELFSPGSQLS